MRECLNVITLANSIKKLFYFIDPHGGHCMWASIDAQSEFHAIVCHLYMHTISNT
jgi:hypothetical protein